MLIEELIRLGRPLLEGDMDPEEVLALITDASDVRVKNFYRHVFVVELPADGKGETRVLPMQEFGQENEEGDFEVNRPQAAAAPFIFPSGGNQLNPQGQYGLPVYPIYHKHFFGNPKERQQALREGFLKNKEAIRYFLRQRRERTSQFKIDDTLISAVVEEFHRVLIVTDFGNLNNVLGVLILVRCGLDEFYSGSTETSRGDRIGQTATGRAIVPNYSRIIEGVWAAKIKEGREAGMRTGACSFTGAEGQVVSAYCKAWPWAFPTWTCPLPNGGDEEMLVEGIGLSSETYRALTLGACVFNRLTRRVSSLVLPEMFCPADTRTGKDQAQQRKLSDLPAIYGSAFLLPVQDNTLAVPNQRCDFVRGVRAMLADKRDDPTLEDRYIEAVVGFDAFLPPEMANDDYRLTLVYFSGDYSRGDIKLRAFIQDVIPSTLGALRELAFAQATSAMTLLRTLLPMSNNQRAYLGRCYQSVPYLLARAYGGAYLWQQLEALLHRKSLDVRRVTANVAHRILSVVPQWPNSRYTIFDEVGFYLSFLDFVDRANHALANRGGGGSVAIRPWKELLELVENKPVAEMTLSGDPAEIGFACGALIRRFSRSYYAAMQSTKSDADYLRDRVQTFGTDLRPQVIHDKGLRMILELPNRLRTLNRNRDLEERVGAAIVAFQQTKEEIERHKDDFVTAFWAGYALQGYDRPRKSKEEDKQPDTQTQE